MSTHKNIDKLCCVAVVICLLITVLFLNGEALGIKAADKVMGYENRLFDAERVHTVDIVMDDWESFIASCENEEYAMCNVVIDGEAYKNVGIRAKGNTSLSTVSSMNSDRYSFKIEFDQYDSTGSYYGLDKLSLNNVIQDNTYMKDFLVYQMMNEFGVDAPLCSYVYITVNGEDWGLYLAVEGIEDAFLQRNYGNDYGELYKPDSLSFGGGRGNGKDFDMSEFDFSEIEDVMGGSFGGGQNDTEDTTTEDDNTDSGMTFPGGMQMPEGMEIPEGMGRFPGMGQTPEGMEIPEGMGQFPGMGQMPEGMEIPEGMGQFPGMGQMPEGTETPEDMEQMPDSSDWSDISDMFGGDFSAMMGGGFGGFGMGSSDVKLQYIDDDPSSYSNIFNNAKTDITESDAERLIAALKQLSAGENIEEVVDVEEVIRYFVVHNFVVNGDSYTGSMIHNYYLYEEDGQLSMIPWDYNLAYGTFQGSNADSAVNDPIDSPVSGGMSDRPMISWIFENEEYLELYHEFFNEFIETMFDSGAFAELVDSTAKLIAPYVEKDPTKFCTYEEFETGVETIREFCLLRAESVSGQLDGSIPSTSEGQQADSSALVDASSITISAMGTMGGSMGGGMQMPGGMQRPDSSQDTEESEDTDSTEDMTQMPGGMTFPGGMQMPEGMTGRPGSTQTQEGQDGTSSPSGQMPDWSGSMTGGKTAGAAGMQTVSALISSLLCLLVGLVVVIKYKRG